MPQLLYLHPIRSITARPKHATLRLALVWQVLSRTVHVGTHRPARAHPSPRWTGGGSDRHAICLPAQPQPGIWAVVP